MGTLEAASKTRYVKIVKDGPSKKVEMITAGLTFIVSTLLIVFAIYPTFQTVENIDREIREKKSVSVALKNKLEALTSLDTQYSEYREIFEDFTLIYPTSENFSLILANMDALVTKNGFVLKSIGFNENKSKSYESNIKTLSPYSVKLSVTGSKGNLINLLKSLEQMPMYPIVESVSFSTKTDVDGNLSFSINMRVYGIDNINFYD